MVGDVCCAVVYARGKNLRWAALLIGLPSLFIV